MKGSKPPADQRQMKQEHFKVAHDAKKHISFSNNFLLLLTVSEPSME